jgi:hypothetical protein
MLIRIQQDPELFAYVGSGIGSRFGPFDQKKIANCWLFYSMVLPGSGIRDKHPGSYFREISKKKVWVFQTPSINEQKFLLKKLRFLQLSYFLMTCFAIFED